MQTRVNGHLYRHARVAVCADVYIDMCIDLHEVLCTDVCVDMCMDMLTVGMCVDACVNMCAGGRCQCQRWEITDGSPLRHNAVCIDMSQLICHN